MSAPVSDFSINSSVRRMLARHWVDLGEIRFSTFHGTVRFMGRILRLGGSAGGHVDSSFLETLEYDTRRVPGVRAVYFQFTNWIRDSSGRWVGVDQSKVSMNSIELDEKQSGSSAKVYVLDKKGKGQPDA